MKDLQKQANEKMLKEMKSNKSPITERLHVFLCNVEDTEVLEAILNEKRTLHETTEYCYAKGSKIAIKGVADVTEEMEKAWCLEYYLKESIDSSDLKVLPPEKGEIVEKEVIKEVEKVVYKEPTFDEIGKYLAQQKSKEKKPVQKEERMSLFD